MDIENPATFTEHRAAYAAMKDARDAWFLAAQDAETKARELAESVLEYFDTGNGLDSIRELAEGIAK